MPRGACFDRPRSKRPMQGVLLETVVVFPTLLETTEGFTMKGFKLVEGTNGLFVGFPSQKNSEGEYKDTIFADKVLRQKVNQLAKQN